MNHYDLGALNRVMNTLQFEQSDSHVPTTDSINAVFADVRRWTDGVLLDAFFLTFKQEDRESAAINDVLESEVARRHEIRKQLCLKCQHAYSFDFPGGREQQVVCRNCGNREPEEKMAAIARAPFRPGDHVRMKTSGETGRVRFIGAIEFATTHMPYHWLVTYIVRMDTNGDMHTDVTSIEAAEPVAGSASH